MRNGIYFAGAISDIDWNKATEWRDKLYYALIDATKGQWRFFDPCDHWNEFGEVISPEESVEYDLDHLRHSRIMILSVEHGHKSTGTLIEAGVAYERRIPIIIYNPNNEELHPWLRRIATHVCTSFDGMLMFLCDHYLNEV